MVKALKRKAFILGICAAISAAMFAASAYAESNLVINSVTAQKQQHSMWCWAATSSMAGMYLGATNATQSNIVTKVYGSPYDISGTVYDMQKGLAAYNVKSTPLVTTIAYSDILYNINHNMNMIASVTYSNGAGHALLVRGYYYNTSNSTQNLYYIDPADGSSNVMPYSTFKGGNWTWVNTLTAIYV